MLYKLGSIYLINKERIRTVDKKVIVQVETSNEHCKLVLLSGWGICLTDKLSPIVSVFKSFQLDKWELLHVDSSDAETLEFVADELQGISVVTARWLDRLAHELVVDLAGFWFITDIYKKWLVTRDEMEVLGMITHIIYV